MTKIVKLNFAAPTIIQLDAGEQKCIVEEGVIYVPLVSGLSGGGEVATVKETPAAPPTPSKAPSVADDTKVTKGKKSEEKPAPAKAEGKGKEQKKEIPAEEWEGLESGTNVLVELDLEEYKGKLWSAEIVEHKDDKTYVKFHEDEQTDYLREGDKLFVFDAKF